MFNYIKGILTEKTENGVTVECGGMGFEILTSSYTANNLEKDKECKVFTYLQVREDGMSLFGFSHKEEKALFQKLISVSGIGAKSAINILSSESMEKIAYYIASADVAALSKLKGIGKKTAERIIVELKDKVKLEKSDGISLPSFTDGDFKTDAVYGLMSLGFTRREAEEGVSKAILGGANNLEEIISLGIKKMIK